MILIAVFFLTACNQEEEILTCVIKTSADITVFEFGENEHFLGSHLVVANEDGTSTIYFNMSEYTGIEGDYCTYELDAIFYVNKYEECLLLPTSTVTNVMYEFNNQTFDTDLEEYIWEKSQQGMVLDPECTCE